ncbi:GreA/GreB family elongation factor [Mycobacterium sp. 852014-50255_SCH5639931]|uniref:GreA/GreB family elongation factor n=1 Tax=Mycobacterium sp. 852014-50255_SCH5639931 TaxID=1834112 RepID=UPI0007FD2E29|nr:GreA/GreB family elongation factor [Mycobacterium sp. 852014-50255_SCH5639931]OBB65859.1 transcription elongation factor GreA [Mycobacterium sp. 852014-50255_SCH5639931]
MISFAPVYITAQHYRRLQDELSTLRSLRSIEVPDDSMDYGGNRGARPAERQKRIREIEDLLATAAVRDDPAGERVAGPGMVLTIRYDASGETETLLLGRQGTEDAEFTVYSMASPLGRCIAGARPGEQRIYAIPHDRGRLVTLLKAVPYRPPSPNPQGRNDGRCQTPGAGVMDRRPSTTIAA